VSARVRLALGVAGVLATASVVRRNRVGPRELQVFRAVNDVPDRVFGPVWVVMQAGALGAAPTAAVLARAAGRPRLATHLLAGGGTAWLLSKVVKVFVQRPRPVALLPDTHRRGKDAAGLGYVSGHAAVVAALTAAALPQLGPKARAVALAVAPTVGLARMYVGAHLPLDVLGGAALGIAVDAAVSLLAGPADDVGTANAAGHGT
jgi:membrane-associated phospholipid phosphatase